MRLRIGLDTSYTRPLLGTLRQKSPPPASSLTISQP